MKLNDKYIKTKSLKTKVSKKFFANCNKKALIKTYDNATFVYLISPPINFTSSLRFSPFFV